MELGREAGVFLTELVEVLRPLATWRGPTVHGNWLIVLVLQAA
jgi:hypothetical protein